MRKICLLLSVIMISTMACTKQKEQQPNVIIIFNDDQGYQDLGCFGSPDIETPRVDNLAQEGMLFTNFYVASAVCSASRAALLTGCYPQRVGVKGVFWPNSPNGLNPRFTTIAEVLKTAGYATMAVGKWHLGDETQFLPTNQGFDSYYGIPYSNDMYPSKSMKYSDDCLFRNGFNLEKLDEIFANLEDGKQPREVKNNVPLMQNEACIEFPCDQTSITRRYTDEGIKFINKNVEEKKPFFLYLANTMPHIPIFVSDEFKGKTTRGPYGDAIEEIDYNTGRILDQLKALGIEDNTIVIFTSDNGPWLGLRKGLSGCALPLFEGKFTTFEGGMRVPCIIRWPEKIPAGAVCSDLMASIDLFPTLTKLAGAALPETEIDGKDAIDLWTAKKGAKTTHEYYFYVFNKGQAVRWGDWKYHEKEIYHVKETARPDDGPALYNLDSDIGESVNVIDQYPEVAERMAKALDAHIASLKKDQP